MSGASRSNHDRCDYGLLRAPPKALTSIVPLFLQQYGKCPSGGRPGNSSQIQLPISIKITDDCCSSRRDVTDNRRIRQAESAMTISQEKVKVIAPENQAPQSPAFRLR